MLCMRDCGAWLAAAAACGGGVTLGSCMLCFCRLKQLPNLLRGLGLQRIKSDVCQASAALQARSLSGRTCYTLYIARECFGMLHLCVGIRSSLHSKKPAPLGSLHSLWVVCEGYRRCQLLRKTKLLGFWTNLKHCKLAKEN